MCRRQVVDLRQIKAGTVICGGLQVVNSREVTLQTHQRGWINIQSSHVMSFVTRTSFIATLGLFIVAALLSADGTWANARNLSACTYQDRTHIVAGGETLADVANRYGMSPNDLSQENGLFVSDSLYTNQRLCIPNSTSNHGVRSYVDAAVRTQTLGKRESRAAQVHALHQASHAATTTTTSRASHSTSTSTASHAVASYTANTSVSASSNVAVGSLDVFPAGQCTWWADDRYHQLHGVYVPWTTNANAWQWVARAYQFGWNVSSMPHVGSIIVLQPDVQGAGSLGHVGVVEQVLSNGQVIASSMNWGANPQAVSYFQFTPGSGVSFVDL